jgi:hypothetical protein
VDVIDKVLSNKKAQKIALYAGLGALAYVMIRGIGGTAKDLTSGIIGGVFDGVGGVLAGAYEAIPEPIKPTNNENVIYQGVNGLVRVLPGADEHSTLGTWLYDITHQ